MASTTFSGPVTSTNGFIGPIVGNVTGNVIGNVTGTVTGNLDATTGYVQLTTATTAEIASATSTVNTVGKAAGTIVFNTSLGTLKIATGATATSTWVNADGTTAVTPS
jgi:hypothetical protein